MNKDAVAGLLHKAVQLHKNNNLEDASSLYNAVLEAEPLHTEALRLLGTAKLQLNQLSEAEKLLEKAREIDPANLDVLNTLALILQTQNRLEAAGECFEKILELDPKNISALTNCGILFSQQQKFESAFELLTRAYAIDNTSIESLYNLALCLQQMNRMDEAEIYYKRLLELDPTHQNAHTNLGLIYRQQNKHALAEQSFMNALRLDLNSVDTAYNIASLWLDQKRTVEAENLLQQVIEKQPNHFEAWNDLGELKFQKLELEEAYALFTKAFQIAPKRWEAHFNLGLTLQELGRFEESAAELQTALAIAPENHLIHFALSEVYLAMHNFTAGWIEYEFRLKFEMFKDRVYSVPRWNGEHLAGKSIFVFEEQGSGDTFQFIRYLKVLKASGARIIFQAKPQHLRLFSGLEYIDSLVTDDSIVLENKCDFYSPLLSLPKLLWDSHKEYASKLPYLQSQGNICQNWNAHLQNTNDLRIGLFWCGNTFSNINKKRHCSLNDLLPLTEIAGTKFYSLQVAEQAEELAASGFSDTISNLGQNINDFADTAAIISQLDLIVTIDSSVAHLAGALGKKTLLLLAATPDWRWIQENTTSNWYPNTTLIRQSSRGNWSEVVNELKAFITHAVHSGSQRKQHPLVFALSSGENFGWGVCSKYLTKETLEKRELIVYNSEYTQPLPEDSVIFHAIQGANLKTLQPVRGKINIGYTFFENELNEDAVKCGKELDYLFGGSTWNKIKLEEQGLAPSGLLIQGVDPDIFYPYGDNQKASLFTIFSGGKFELRKGQDMVLRAVSIMQQKYKDVILINAWYNIWQQTMISMGVSKFITFNPRGERWQDFVTNLCVDNNLDLARVLTLPLTDNKLLPDIYSKTDIGLFPNRAEGGTNLVLMEYMACGKPVIASYNTGHIDVLTQENSLPLMEQTPFHLYDTDKVLTADWREPSLDEIVAKLEWAYHHRDEIKAIGKRAGDFMTNFTWEKSSASLLSDLAKLGVI